MKKNLWMAPTLLVLCLFIGQSFFGQDILRVVGYSKEGTADAGSKPATRAYFIRNRDSSFEKLTYKAKGVCQSHETFADSGFSIRHGIYVTYTRQGWVSEMGFYNQGKRFGKWYRRIDVFYYAIELYVQGKAIAIDSMYINPTAKSQSFVKNKDNGGAQVADASFPGGERGFKKYLDDRLIQYPFTGKDETFSALLAFFVQPSGTVMPAVVWQSNNFEIDFFARKILQDMPAWTPAKEIATGNNLGSLYFQRITLD